MSTLKITQDLLNEIQTKYVPLADGTKLVYLDTQNNNSLHVDPIEYVVTRLTGKHKHNLRICVSEIKDTHNFIYGYNLISLESAPPELGISTFDGIYTGVSVEKAMAATPGTEYSGWKRAKMYRLNQNEIDFYLKGKVFFKFYMMPSIFGEPHPNLMQHIK